MRARTARIAIDLGPGGPRAVESVSPSGGEGYVWTRKCAGIPAHGEVELAGRRIAIDAEAVLDETAGYHARHTRWTWSAGVGRGANGERVGWNLVTGVNDDPEASERTLWIDGEPREVEPVELADDLSAVRFAAGEALEFRAWATREHGTNLGIVRSRYRQPFGVFSGELPGGVRLEGGYGVMEWHEAWW